MPRHSPSGLNRITKEITAFKLADLQRSGIPVVAEAKSSWGALILMLLTSTIFFFIIFNLPRILGAIIKAFELTPK